MDKPGVTWTKSSQSHGNSNCLEVTPAFGKGDEPSPFVMIRDSVSPGMIVTVSRADWDLFLKSAKAGEFDKI